MYSEAAAAAVLLVVSSSQKHVRRTGRKLKHHNRGIGQVQEGGGRGGKVKVKELGRLQVLSSQASLRIG